MLLSRRWHDIHSLKSFWNLTESGLVGSSANLLLPSPSVDATFTVPWTDQLGLPPAQTLYSHPRCRSLGCDHVAHVRLISHMPITFHPPLDVKPPGFALFGSEVQPSALAPHPQPFRFTFYI